MPPAVEEGAHAGAREGAVDGRGGPTPGVRRQRGPQELGQLERADTGQNIQAGAVIFLRADVCVCEMHSVDWARTSYKIVINSEEKKGA